MNFVIEYSYLIPLLPLIGAVVAGFFGARYLKGQSHWPIWIGVGISALMSFGLLFGMLGTVEEGQPFFRAPDWFTWMRTGPGTGPETFIATAGALFDPLSAVMLCVVCGIGFLITVFAAGYMKGEEGYFRFFAYLGLFIFAMTCLVMGNNLVMLYLGWEGVGLCSYLLIGYYYDKPAAREAAKKAFLVNRIGDLGFGLGIMLTFLVFGTVSYFGSESGQTTGFLTMAADPDYIAGLEPWRQDLIPFIPFLLMVGAFGKSAQFPLYVWLPDAMEGPTPVSALIHAATMVTAGVYMIARCSTVFVQVPAAMLTVAAVGLFTALFAATIALRQFDLKKIFAYSTISQLGFMFVAVGLLAPVAGVFHLVTHAFFKALLFLSSGVVMHAMAGELDLRKMSGLKRVLPKTRWLMLIGCLALAGMIPFSGFWSKDEIVAAAYGKHTAAGTLAFALLLLTALLTAYYTFRLYFRVFEGPEVIPTPPVDHHGAFAGHDSHADDFARKSDAASASASAIQTGTAHDSGVDEHLAQEPAHHGSAARDAHGGGHGHGHGHGHGDHQHDHEPMIMILPLIVLAIGAVLAGFLNTPWNHTLGDFLGHSPSFFQGYEAASGLYPAHHVDEHQWGRHSEESAFHPVPMFASIAVSALGIGLAYLLHLRDRRRADDLARMVPGMANAIENKYWVDEAYQNVIVEPLRGLGRLFFAVDRYIVDGLVNLVAYMPMVPGWALKLGVQRGYLQGYAAVMLFGIAAILLVIFL